MKRTAVLAILFLLFARPGLAVYSADHQTFLVAFTADGKLVVASHSVGLHVLSVPRIEGGPLVSLGNRTPSKERYRLSERQVGRRGIDGVSVLLFDTEQIDPNGKPAMVKRFEMP